MAFTLYNAPQSTCSQRVRFVLHAKGLDFEEHRLDLFSGDLFEIEHDPAAHPLSGANTLPV